jgi:hypothetical protein
MSGLNTVKPGAIYATKDFVKWGQGASKNFGFLRQLGICSTVGIGLGLAWKVCEQIRPRMSL